MKSIIRLSLSILFFLCLLDWDYGFYQLVRWIALVGFLLLAYYEIEKEEKTLMIIFICLAILFQPIIKVSLGRELWNIVDVVVATWLIFMSYKEWKNDNSF